MLSQTDSKSRFWAVLVLLAAPAASPAGAQQESTCKDIGSLAAQIMQIRQTETPVTTVLETFENQDAPAEFKTLMREIVIIAYEQPAMRSPENKKNQVDRYRNDVEMLCIKGTLGRPQE